MTGQALTVDGRLVLDDRVEPGRIVIEDGRIVAVDTGAPSGPGRSAASDGPLIAPGFVDVHVHGGGGHDAMGGAGALDGMARHLLRHGVTSFLPTAVTAPIDELVAFAERVRAWLPDAPADGAEPLGFNLEGPFLAVARRGAHDPAHLRVPADVPRPMLEPLIDGLRLLTIAPELPGATDLIRWLRDRGVATSIGHSAATIEEARAGYEAGATSTTHLFNAMSGVDHRAPGVAVAALLDDAAYVELIADGIHVDRRVVAVDHAAQARGPAAARQRCHLARRARATDAGGSVASTSRSSGQRVTLVGDLDARRVRPRARHRGPESRGLRGPAAGRRRGGGPQPARPARHLRPRADRGGTARRSRRARRRTRPSAGSCAPAPGFAGAAG